MKVLIVGLGSVGSKHIDALLKIDDKTEIFALRSSKNSKKDFRVIDLYDWGFVVFAHAILQPMLIIK